MTEPRPPRRMMRSPAWLPHAVLVVVGVLGLAAAAGLILYQLRALIYMLFLGIFVAVALEPAVQRLVKRGWRRRRATMFVFSVTTVLFLGFIVALIPVFVTEAARLAENIPEYLEALQDLASRYFQIDLVDPEISEQFQDLGSLLSRYGSTVAGGIFAIGNTVFGAIFQFVTVALFAYYLVAEGPTWRRSVLSVLPQERQRELLNIWEVSVDKTGGYVYSRAVLAIVTGLFTFVVLVSLGVPSAAALALWMGVLSQFVPVIGTYVGMVLPALAALSVSPLTALWVVVAMVAYQQLENYVVAPRVTARTMAIHPAITIGALIAGASLLGAMGAVLALPVAATIQALISTTIHRHNLIESEALKIEGEVAT
ncbi:MAG: AI-2E family transporter [Acidimicrobiia bacterium]